MVGYVTTQSRMKATQRLCPNGDLTNDDLGHDDVYPQTVSRS